jgi:hypothetical protein
MPLSHWVRILGRGGGSRRGGKEAILMVIQLVMGFVADLVFGSARTLRSSFDSEVDRYLERRGFDVIRPKQTGAR